VRDESFRDFILEQLSDLEDVDCRTMFGGFGLYGGGQFFAIVFEDRLYFRTDDRTRDAYLELGSEPFRPNERQTLKNYYEVPAEVVEDRERLVEWALGAVHAQPTARGSSAGGTSRAGGT
jgi:DNA transformation protein